MPISLDIVVPVLNEEHALHSSIGRLHSFLSANFGSHRWHITIADNGSTDSTPSVLHALSKEFTEVTHIRVEQRGRGRALKKAWLQSNSDIVCYMDVDLSTDLAALPNLVSALTRHDCEIAVGSSLTRGAEVKGRTLKRELISRAYNLLIRLMFFTKFRDAQCGFKAATRRAAQDIVPLVQDTGWFFDTELLILAEKNGYAVKEIPVAWMDDPDSRVKIISTAWEDFKGLVRLRFGGLSSASRTLSRNTL